MLRVISEIRPAFVVAENVRGAVNLALDTVYSGLVGEGYKVYPYVIPASAVGAPHQRERLFVFGVRSDVADCASERLEGLWPAREQESEIHAGEIVPVCDSVRDGKLWPTPQQKDYRSGDEPDSIRATRKRELGWSINLNDAVKLWPTPTSTERSGINPNTGSGAGLTHAVSLWRTPDANCDRGASSQEWMEWKKKEGMPISINDQVGKGSLNPAWVECLMGFPLGWTDIDCDEPEPWPGWPALMGGRLWRTMDASDNCDRKLHCNSRGEPMLSGQTKLSDAGQYPYEPPRTVMGCQNRAKRLKCLGNAVVPAQARPFFEAIRQIHHHITCECFT